MFSHTASKQKVIYGHISIKKRSRQKEIDLDIAAALQYCLINESQLTVSQQNFPVTHFDKVMYFRGKFLSLKFINDIDTQVKHTSMGRIVLVFDPREIWGYVVRWVIEISAFSQV